MAVLTYASQADQPAARSTPAVTAYDRWCVIGFALAGVAFQLGLYLLGDTALRMPLRIGIFATSLAMLICLPRNGRGSQHPAARIFPAIVLVLFLNLVQPGAGLLAGVAQATLYIAVLAPLIWVPRLRVDRNVFRQVALVLWAFHTASALFGALQVAYPGRYDGALAGVIDDKFAGAMTITLDDGRHMLRPKGLTDSPGGAGVSGVCAMVLGMGVLLTERSILLRFAAAASMALSLYAIYLSQGRTNIVLVGLMAITVLAVLLKRGDRKRAGLLLAILGGAIVVGTSFAFATGGQQTIDRFATLLADNPQTVAYQNRGQFIDAIIEQDMYLYPLGAGGGRWGMINGYFGDPDKSLYAEMTWQALLYDGGLPLIGLYLVMLALLLASAWRIAVAATDPVIGCWAAVLLGFIVSTIAGSFVYPIFIKDTGLQMILLCACLFAANQLSATRQNAARTSPSRSQSSRTRLASMA